MAERLHARRPARPGSGATRAAVRRRVAGTWAHTGSPMEPHAPRHARRLRRRRPATSGPASWSPSDVVGADLVLGATREHRARRRRAAPAGRGRTFTLREFAGCSPRSTRRRLPTGDPSSGPARWSAPPPRSAAAVAVAQPARRRPRRPLPAPASRLRGLRRAGPRDAPGATCSPGARQRLPRPGRTVAPHGAARGATDDAARRSGDPTSTRCSSEDPEIAGVVLDELTGCAAACS